MTIAINWSLMVTKEMKDAAAYQQLLDNVKYELTRLRQEVDSTIEPLSDAVLMGIATPAEEAALNAWKLYRIELMRVPKQAGYPTDIVWPVKPAEA